MKIGFIGLGRMGKEMVLHLLERGVDVMVYNRSYEKVAKLESEIQNSKFKIQNEGKFVGTESIKELISDLDIPRIIWLMVEHGRPVDEVLDQLIKSGVSKGDIVIDGGNSFYKDTVRRYKKLKNLGIHYIDAGTSGGLEGARNGACIMIGGEKDLVMKLSWLWNSLSGSHLQEDLLQRPSEQGGWAYFGSSGAGHFVKMVHNGVEYGMLQAIGEGFEILAKGPYKLDLHKIAQNWTRGSVVRGWLMDLLVKALRSDPKLDQIVGVIGGGTTGKWTVDTAKELGVKVPVIEDSIKARDRSRKKPTFAGRVVAALRYQFGRHEMKLGIRNNELGIRN